MTRAAKKFQRATQARQASALGGAAFTASQAARGLSQLPGSPGGALAQAVRFGSTVGCLCARLRSPPSPAARCRDIFTNAGLLSTLFVLQASDVAAQLSATEAVEEKTKRA